MDDGVRNWARSMRQAARRAEEHAQKWKVNLVAGLADQPKPISPPSVAGQLTEQEAAAYAQRVVCLCEQLPKITGDTKKDHVFACTDIWLEYLNGKIELPDLKQRVDQIYGEGSFEKAKEQSKQVCPV